METPPESTPEPLETAPEQPNPSAELIAQLQRLQAEFENYRRRVQQEQAVAAERGQEKVLKDIFTAVDSLEMALKHHTLPAKPGKSEADLRTGLELVYAQMIAALQANGVERISTEGPVDPRLHEVYMTEAADVPANTILDCLQQGYHRHGTVLRTAKVKAARKE